VLYSVLIRTRKSLYFRKNPVPEGIRHCGKRAVAAETQKKRQPCPDLLYRTFIIADTVVGLIVAFMYLGNVPEVPSCLKGYGSS